MDRLERDASGWGRHWQVLRGLRVRLHLGDFEGSIASRDGRIAGHDYLVGCENCCSSAVTSSGWAADGTTESSATRTMSTMGPAGQPPPPTTASEGGRGPADQPAGSASPLLDPRSPSRCESAEPYDERARQRQSRPGSNWHADTYYGAAATILRHHPLGS